MQPDGKVVVVAGADLPADETTDQVVVLRVTSSGRPDASFGREGVARASLQEFQLFEPRAIVLLIDGTLLAVGSQVHCCASPCFRSPKRVWAAFTARGHVDGRFAEAPPDGGDAQGVALDAQGRILVASAVSTGCLAGPDGGAFYDSILAERIVGPTEPSPPPPRGRINRPALPDRPRLPVLPLRR